jgi:ABC-type cobalamin/Fe3+-siderophores transport system ATPase subunit
LLRVLAGLESIDQGGLEVMGVEGNRAGRERLRSRVGLLFQHHEYLPELPFTVEDVVGFGRVGRASLGLSRNRRDREAVGRALERLGLDAMRQRLYRELSGGERQKVQLARLLAQEAELLLLDEPAAGLDLDWQERLTALVGELFDEARTTVVMVTHEVDRLPARCDQALLLRQGRVVAQGTPAAVFTAKQLSAAYDCEMEVRERLGRIHAFSVAAGSAGRVHGGEGGAGELC